MPKVTEMTDFNLWTFNTRVFPGHRPSAGAQGRPRARAGRQSHHDQSSDPYARLRFPRDLHRRRLGAGKRALAGGDHRRPGRRDARLRVRRDEEGDWALHCHKSHHTMNAMGHNVRNFIGVQQRDLRKAISRLAPDIHGDGLAPAWPKWARWKCRCRTTRCR